MLKYFKFCDPARHKLTGHLRLLVWGARILEDQSCAYYIIGVQEVVYTQPNFVLPQILLLGVNKSYSSVINPCSSEFLVHWLDSLCSFEFQRSSKALLFSCFFAICNMFSLGMEWFSALLLKPLYLSDWVSCLYWPDKNQSTVCTDQIETSQLFVLTR